MLLFTLLVGSLFTISLFAYFFPYMVSLGLGGQYTQVVAVINLLLGWCVVGWIVALVFAVTGGVQKTGKPKIGGIILLLTLLAILGYLSAYATGKLCVDVVQYFDKVVTLPTK